mmetsp:Transcript_13127/g.18809  ORF Transcript_13127/g.18809 Transcript_13127/m.18809 type:complete len:130 (+) Transcript_13127:467-856(+)
MKSWIEIPSNSDFSLGNIPFGICSFPSSSSSSLPLTTLAPSTPRCCTAIGNHAIDLHLLAEAGLFDNLVVTTTTTTKGCVELCSTALDVSTQYLINLNHNHRPAISNYLAREVSSQLFTARQLFVAGHI